MSEPAKSEKPTTPKDESDPVNDVPPPSTKSYFCVVDANPWPCERHRRRRDLRVDYQRTKTVVAREEGDEDQ